MKHIVVILCLLTVQVAVQAQQQDVIIASFEQGDVEKLSQYFDENIDLTVLQNEGIYSKAQS
ncbi:MAG TPA: DUF4783 domain-containing protein, partial [Bacteroidales bacterium]|nr:DUF4783 domain-containing protein [Bacteroidales bacterium]